MFTQLLSKSLISMAVFFLINAMGGLSLKFGYTAMHYKYKREENFGFNLIFKIFTPILCTIAISILLYNLKLDMWYKNVWIAVGGSWLIRIIYIAFWERSALLSWKTLFVQAMASTGIAYWLYCKLISQPTLLFPSRDNMVSEIWLIVVLFLYKAMEDIQLGEKASFNRKFKYTNESYNKMKRKFGEIIDSHVPNKELEILTYSILIFENYNRPRIARIAEFATSLFRKNGTYGIMQVKSPKPIDDKKSIVIGIKKLEELYKKVKSITDDKKPKYKDSPWQTGVIIKRVAWHYNNSVEYSEEISMLYDLLQKYQYTEPKPVDPDDRFNAFYSSEFPGA